MEQEVKSETQWIPIEQLVRGTYQPRRHFDPIALQELAMTIKKHGLIQPIVVRPKGKERYEIIAGERRWRAAQLAGLETVRCEVNDYADSQVAEMAVIENLQREDLNPIEEAMAYQRLIDEFDYRHEEVADIVGKSRSKITNSLRLLKLDGRVQDCLTQKQMSEGQGKLLAGIPEEKQYELAQMCITKGWSVKQLEQAIKRLSSPESSRRKNTDIEVIERLLSDHVGSPAQIVQNEEGKWQLVFNCTNLDIMQGIFQKMNFKYEEDCGV
jgi:ParB family chromosome partitioning protein